MSFTYSSQHLMSMELHEIYHDWQISWSFDSISMIFTSFLLHFYLWCLRTCLEKKVLSYLPDAIEEQDKCWSTAFRFGWYRVIEWAFERSRPKRMSGLKPFALNQGFKTSNGAAIWVQNDLSQWGDAQRNVHTFWTVNHYIRILLERNAKVK